MKGCRVHMKPSMASSVFTPIAVQYGQPVLDAVANSRAGTRCKLGPCSSPTGSMFHCSAAVWCSPLSLRTLMTVHPVQVRAWGLFLKDVHDRMFRPLNGHTSAADALPQIIQDCLQPTPKDRPTFAKLAETLSSLL